MLSMSAVQEGEPLDRAVAFAVEQLKAPQQEMLTVCVSIPPEIPQKVGIVLVNTPIHCGVFGCIVFWHPIKQFAWEHFPKGIPSLK